VGGKGRLSHFWILCGGEFGLTSLFKDRLGYMDIYRDLGKEHT
jgi:hypothetical protein